MEHVVGFVGIGFDGEMLVEYYQRVRSLVVFLAKLAYWLGLLLLRLEVVALCK